ncbi:MAG: hypothetical protein JWO30_2881 [Fibrobacteres bacterium]|nr:hypothetical protein [Fibrobacterota bacterium]
MKGSRPLMAAATAVGLLAAGCDYWKNLVNEASVTKVPLTLVVRDAWTRNTLPTATCVDSARSLTVTMNDEGLHRFPDAGTGPYNFTCTADDYFPATKHLEVGGDGDSVVVEMARLGEESWYPGDTTRQVMFPEPFETLRYPPRFQLASLPKNNGSVFRYAWTFAQNRNLDRPITMARAGLLNLDLAAEARDVAHPGPDTVTVTVYSALRGPDSLYVVRTSIMPFQWVRNKLPAFALENSPPERPRVGCLNSRPLSFPYTAMDSDGTCQRVVFYTLDTNSSLGNVRFERTCTDHRPINLPLHNPFTSLSDSVAYLLDDKLFVEVWDDNGEVRRDSIEFKSRSNIQITAGGGLIDPQPAYFRNTVVRSWIDGSDVDGPIYGFKVDWGDGSLPARPGILNDAVHYWRDTTFHIYRDTGNFRITNYAIGDCDPESSLFVFPDRDIIHVRDDTKPKITLDTLGYNTLGDPRSYQIYLRVTDIDADDGIDSLEIVLDWGDGNLDTMATNKGRSYENHALTHRYAADPGVGEFYKLHVKATDSQTGSDVAIRLIPKPGP